MQRLLRAVIAEAPLLLIYTAMLLDFANKCAAKARPSFNRVPVS